MVNYSEGTKLTKIEILVKNIENSRSLTRHKETHENSYMTFNGDWGLVHTYNETDKCFIVTPYNLNSIVNIKVDIINI